MASDTTETFLERLTLYCNAMQVPLPPLRFDKDEPDEVLMTQSLMIWIRAEGISLNWLIPDDKPVPAPVVSDAMKMVEGMSKDQRARLLAALRDHKQNGGDLERVLRRHGLGE